MIPSDQRARRESDKPGGGKQRQAKPIDLERRSEKLKDPLRSLGRARKLLLRTVPKPHDDNCLKTSNLCSKSKPASTGVAEKLYTTPEDMPRRNPRDLGLRRYQNERRRMPTKSSWLHGGSGSTLEEIHETLDYGVIKMNVDTDCQYTFTRPIVEDDYDGVLKIEGEVGNKKVYDPRAYLKKGMQGMKDRVIQAITDLRGAGTSIKIINNSNKFSII